MTDVMWVKPEGTRVLLAPSELVASFVSSIYSFDVVEVVRISVQEIADGFELTAGPLALAIIAGRPRRIFGLRPSFLRRSLLWARIEDAILRKFVGHLVLKGAEGVRLYGKTPSGMREWYLIDEYRPVVEARASVDGRSLGALRPLHPKLRVGLSEFPRQPALVRCSPVLEGSMPQLHSNPFSGPQGTPKQTDP